MKLSLSEMLNENFSADNIDKLLREAEKSQQGDSKEDIVFTIEKIETIVSVLIPPDKFTNTIQRFLKGDDDLLSKYPSKVSATRSTDSDDRGELGDKEKEFADNKMINRADAMYNIAYADLLQLERGLIASFNQEFTFLGRSI